MTIDSIARIAAAAAITAASAASAQTDKTPHPSPLPASGEREKAAPAPKLLHVIAFGGGHNLPIWAAQRQGFFDQHGVKVALTFTPSSEALVQSLFEGKQDIGIGSVDNVVAYEEGQGEVNLGPNPDLFAFFGGDDGFLSLVSAPPVKTFDALRGKTISVDALTNGFAFVLFEMLQKRGVDPVSGVKYAKAGGTPFRFRDLMAGKHDATLLRTPFDLIGQDKGFNVLARGDEVGPYMGTVGMARRSWAGANADALIGFLRGYHAGLQWSFDPANREIAQAILVANLKDMSPALARKSLEVLLAPKGGLFKDMALDPARLKTVLALRSKYAKPKKDLTDPGKYVDASYLAKALAERGASR
jgi:ABC-type nitrate/sulfonate/bicarbonate transport system substrate-binding protein